MGWGGGARGEAGWVGVRSVEAGVAPTAVDVRTRYYGRHDRRADVGWRQADAGVLRSAVHGSARLEGMFAPFTLEGTHVRLEPLSHDHVDELLEAATGDRSSFGFTLVPSDRAAMTAYVEKALAHAGAGDQVPFATRSVALGTVVGATRFYELEPWDWTELEPGATPAPHGGVRDRASIGHTWLGPAVQRTPVNTEAKLLMLGHAFETWRVRAVRLQTDSRNERSRAAIARLGCSLDGVLRVDRPAPDGAVRHSAVFSMTADEWPAARSGLEQRLGR